MQYVKEKMKCMANKVNSIKAVNCEFQRKQAIEIRRYQPFSVRDTFPPLTI